MSTWDGGSFYDNFSQLMTSFDSTSYNVIRNDYLFNSYFFAKRLPTAVISLTDYSELEQNKT